MAIVAVLGTTISPYLFFWQAEQEVEEEREDPDASPLTSAPEQAAAAFTRIRIDTYLGMGLSNLIALFIVITAAATLHAQRRDTDIQTSSQAAEALRAVAGPLTFVVFAAGIIGTGMLALPALAGSAAYAIGELMHWRVGLANKPERAKAFYATIALGMGVGVVLNFVAIDPMKALYWSAVLNGDRGRAGDVHDDASHYAPQHHGRIYLAGVAARAGLDFDRRHGADRGRDDLVLARITPARPVSRSIRRSREGGNPTGGHGSPFPPE